MVATASIHSQLQVSWENFRPPPSGLNCTRLISLADIGTLPQQSYRELRSKEEIRLLVLSSGKHGSPLKDVVFHASIRSAEKYRALSYVWGSPIHKLGLRAPDGSVTITTNIYMALRRLRDSREFITLWVDAICIDQKDRKEKANKICLLYQIFQSATSVVAYLGEETSDSHILAGTIMQITTKEEIPKIWPKNLPPVPASWADESIPPATDPAWQPIGKLFQRSWFRRVSVIQEVIAAAKLSLICVEAKIDWNNIFTAVAVITREIDAARVIYASVGLNLSPFTTSASFKEWEGRGTRWSLVYLLEASRYAESTTKCDRFFALLGFADDGDRPAFQPNYDIPYHALDRKYAWAFIDKGGVMEMLYHAGVKSNTSQGCDDEVPFGYLTGQLERATRKSGTLHASSKRGVKCNASGASKSEISQTTSDKFLGLQGLNVDEVKSMSRFTNIPETMEEYLKETVEMISLLDRCRGGPLSELEWRIPIADASFPELIVSTAEEMKSANKALRYPFTTKSLINRPEADSVATPTKPSNATDPLTPLLRAQSYINSLHTNPLG